MKKLLLLTIYFFSLNAKAQIINSLSTIPLNPTVTDSVYLIANCTFSSGTCDIHTQGFSVSGNNINAWALHCLGMLAVICDHIDTFSLGTLPAGIYVANFQLDHGFGIPTCSPGIVAGPNSSFTFIVSGTTDIPDISLNKEWVNVYPNPGVGIMNIKLNSNMPSLDNSLTLFNLHGKKIWEKENVKLDEDILLDTKKLSSGLYILKMGAFTKKIIVSDQ